MSLCARCGMNEPLPLDPDDFCADCALDAEAILAEIEERKRAFPVGIEMGSFFVQEFPPYACDPCECGGNPKCPRCNP